MRWFRKKKPAAPATGLYGPTGAPFAFKKSNVSQRHRVKVQHVRGFVQPASAPMGVGEQLRALTVVFGLSLLLGTMAVRLAYVAVMPPAEPRASIREMPKDPLRRGDIYDRNGVLLATTLKTYSLYADPKRILDVNEVARRLPTVLRDMRPERLREALADNNRRFVWLKRRMTPTEAQSIHALGLPGLAFREEYVRLYPMGRMAPHVLGGVDIDNNGLAGVERAHQETLKRGDNLHLAVDVRIQDMLDTSVKEAVDRSGAVAGWGAVMDARTGEILGLVSHPDYDPNHFGRAPDAARFNRAVLASYEMGSTFKIFTLAQGLAENKITPDTPIDCREPIRIGRFTIRDFHAKRSILTATEVLRYSSNIGAAKIADMSGPAAQKEFMDSLGMLRPMNIGVSEVGPVRYPTNWGRIQTFTIAFGHGMMVTPMHLVAGVGALSTDGFYRKPSVLKGGDPHEAPRPVLRPETVAQLRLLMRDTVVSGSGRSSQVLGYDIGGKTGTAEKISGGGYDRSKNVVSYVAALPIEDPRFIALVMLDEPKKGFETGGRSAAPAVGALFRRIGLVEGIKPDMKLVETAQMALERKNRRTQPVPPPAAPEAVADLNEQGSAGEALTAAEQPADLAHD